MRRLTTPSAMLGSNAATRHDDTKVAAACCTPALPCPALPCPALPCPALCAHHKGEGGGEAEGLVVGGEQQVLTDGGQDLFPALLGLVLCGCGC